MRSFVLGALALLLIPMIAFAHPPVQYDVQPAPVMRYSTQYPAPVQAPPVQYQYQPPPIQVQPPAIQVQPPAVEVQPPPVKVQPPPIMYQPPPVSIQPPAVTYQFQQPARAYPAPQAAYPPPQAAYPQAAYPPPQAAYPQAAYPQAAYSATTTVRTVRYAAPAPQRVVAVQPRAAVIVQAQPSPFRLFHRNRQVAASCP